MELLVPPLLTTPRGHPAPPTLRRIAAAVTLGAAVLLAAAPVQGVVMIPPSTILPDLEGEGITCVGTAPGSKPDIETNGGIIVYVPLGNGESQYAGHADECPAYIAELPLVKDLVEDIQPTLPLVGELYERLVAETRERHGNETVPGH